jgi:hypothetical protein
MALAEGHPLGAELPSLAQVGRKNEAVVFRHVAVAPVSLEVLDVDQRLGIPADDRGSVAGEALQQVIESTANLRDLLVGQGQWIEVRNRSRPP